MSSHTLRRIRGADVALFREIRLEGLLHHPEAFAASWEEEQAQALPDIAERLENGHVIGGFSDDGVLSGIIGLARSNGLKTRHIGSIWGMYVRPMARGSGLARLLMSAIIDEARPTLRSLRLSVVASNSSAIRLYTSMGFREWAFETEALKVGERYYDELLMRLELGEPA